jgi:cytochrome P450
MRQENGEADDSARDSVLAAYLPFSRGPRSCIGKRIANAEPMPILAAVVWSLEWRFAPGFEPKERDNFELLDHVTGAKNGPILQFRTQTRNEDVFSAGV